MNSHLYGTRLYINTSNLQHNIQIIQKNQKKCTIIAMVKANAYGHGDIVISRKMEEFGIDYFGVADFEEGIRLRASGIKGRIMVMNPGTHNIAKLLDYDLEPVIYNFPILLALSNAVTAQKKSQSSEKKIIIHLKINTGMNRWGFDICEIPELITRIKKIKKIKIQSIYSHLASPSNPSDHKFTQKQIQTLMDQKSKLINEFPYKIDTHIYNSYGLMHFSNMYNFFNYARLGLAIYGGIDALNLKPVAELRCPVSQIKTVSKGESIGYNRAHVTKKKIKIGIVPFGYADGLQRHWGNGLLKFYYKNQFIPTIGEISMDSCIVDLSGINDISESDEVFYFCQQRPIWTLAKELNTIPYEIMATLSKRIKRIYYHDA